MIKMTYSRKACAKVNLTLDILGKYPNGYHKMNMVMASISLADQIDLQIVPGGRVQVFCPQLPHVDQRNNIAARCATAFFNKTKIADGCTIFINKKIPSQAGLGGGSGDGAAVLHLLNQHYKTPLSLDQLMQLGAKIGADIPFMLVGGIARVGGIGEQVAPIASTLAPIYMVVVKPEVGIATGAAFKAFDRQVFKQHPCTDHMVAAVQQGNLQEVGEYLLNVMQLALPNNDVEQAAVFLRQNGAINAIMSGSGSAVFGLFKGKQEALQCQKIYQTKYPSHFCCVCNTCVRPFYTEE